MNSDELLAAFRSVDEGEEDFREDYKRMPFSYPGSKSESLKEILPRLPYLNTFVDVFGGSGVVTLNRRASNLDVFNDRFSGVTAFFRVVRDAAKRQQLVERIALSPHGREEFIWSKQTWKDHDDDLERAARWYVSVQSSFAGRGLYFGRVVKGKGNMWRKIQENLDLFEDIAQRFLTIQIENLDWRHCLSDYDTPLTVYYLDPPYFGHNIYEFGMSKADHLEMCERIFKCHGFVALSGYDTEIYKNFPWDSIHSWSVSDKMTPMTTETVTSIVHANAHVNRGMQEEWLFIKESN